MTKIVHNRSLLVSALLTIGLIIAGIWTNVLGYSANLLPISQEPVMQPFNQDAWLWGRLFGALVVIALARKIEELEISFGLVAVICMSMATGTVVISYHQTLFDPAMLATLGVFVSGSGYMFLVSYIYIFFAKHLATPLIVMGIAVSLIGETFSSVFVNLYVPPVFQTVITIIAPLLVFICYLAAKYFGNTLTLEKISHKVRGRRKFLLLVLVVIFSIQLVFIKALSKVGVWGSSRSNYLGISEFSLPELSLLALIGIILLISAYLVFILPSKRFLPQTRCLIGFVVVLAGLQILALSDDIEFGYFFDAVTSSAELFAHLVFWMMIITCIQQTDTPAFRIIALASPFYAIASLLWQHVIASAHIATSTFVMIVNYILLLAILGVMFSEQISQDFFERNRTANEKQDQIASFSETHGLTKREAEITSCLIDGYSRNEIMQACQLSEGTIKTHISNIYRKLDIHSKGEMLAMYTALSKDSSSSKE